MPTKSSTDEKYILKQGLSDYQYRLQHIFSQQPFSVLGEKTGIKASTLSQYNAKRTHPSLPRLAAIAHECGVSLQWLLFGDVGPASAPQGLKPLESNSLSKEFKVKDDSMLPTIAVNGRVQYKPLKPQPKSKVHMDGLYIVHTKQGEVLRRIQWQDNEECYLVYGDNPNYPQQLIKSLQVVGKVISIIVPVA